jgi:hypothetical protein
MYVLVIFFCYVLGVTARVPNTAATGFALVYAFVGAHVGADNGRVVLAPAADSHTHTTAAAGGAVAGSAYSAATTDYGLHQRTQV